MSALDWLKRPIAHRGLHDADRGIVENSASAVEAAIAHGFGVEIDLQCTADQKAVAFHDDTLDRLTEKTGPVAARSAEDLRAIALRGSSDHILTLEDLLDVVAGRIPLVLEVKSLWTDDRRYEANIAASLAAYPGPVAVMSFDPHAVCAFRRLAPALPRGLVSGAVRERKRWPRASRLERFALQNLLPAAFARPNFIAYGIGALPALAPFVARKVFRLPLLAWTVRTEAERARAKRYADAMIFEGFMP